MSVSENDRKVRSEPGNDLHEGEGRRVRDAIATALREAYGSTPSAVKAVARLTGANGRAVRNWMTGLNAPSAENLILLARHSNHVLDAVLRLAGRPGIALTIEFDRLHDPLAALLDRLAEFRATSSAKPTRQARKRERVPTSRK